MDLGIFRRIAESLMGNFLLMRRREDVTKEHGGSMSAVAGLSRVSGRNGGTATLITLRAPLVACVFKKVKTGYKHMVVSRTICHNEMGRISGLWKGVWFCG